MGSQISLRDRWFTWPHRGGWYSTGKITWKSGDADHELEVTISPTGKSVQVFLDGRKLS